ncbi:MAG: flagellar biosynthetic protein FliQ [Limisphaerales bacterium]
MIALLLGGLGLARNGFRFNSRHQKQRELKILEVRMLGRKQSLMFQAVMLALPILITAMVVGLGISLFQSVTSIQEQTLAFVPKVLGVTAIIVILLP